MAVRTVLPFHVTSRGRPTFTESNRGIRTSPKSRVWLEFSPISVDWASFCMANFNLAASIGFSELNRPRRDRQLAQSRLVRMALNTEEELA